MEVEKNREEYLKLISEVGVDTGLVVWLDSNGFFESPATAKYHHSFRGGLCLHSIEVANYMILLSNSLGLNIEREKLLKIGLLHDIGKSDYFEITSSNKKIYSPDGNKFDELGNYYWKSELSYKTKLAKDRNTYGNHGFNSYLIARKYVDFTDDEISALSNYLYLSNKNDAVEILSLLGKNPIMLLLHVSDLISSYLGGIYDI